MSKVLEGKAVSQKIRMAIIPSETRKFRRLSNEETEKYLKKIEPSKKAQQK
jgi:20S proteasome alpha/beta subunit